MKKCLVIILFRHPLDQATNFLPDGTTALLSAGSRFQTPIQPETLAMPSNDSFQFDNIKHGRPFGPYPAKAEPGDTIWPTQLWAWFFLFKNGQLLAERQVLKDEIISRLKRLSKRKHYGKQI